MTPGDDTPAVAATPEPGPQKGETKFTIEELRESAALRLGVGPHVLDGALVTFNVKKASLTVTEAKRLCERYADHVPEVS